MPIRSTEAARGEGETPAPIHRECESADDPQPPCPRCGGKLVNPEGLGWCPRCGYCKSLVEDSAQGALPSAPPSRQASPLGIVEFGALLGNVPSWLRITLAGVAGVTLISTAANYSLADESFARALWSSLQVVLGLLAVLAAQVWCLFLLAPTDGSLGPKDLILSFRLWGLVLKQLPDMRRQVWVGSWGATAVASAVLIVGGFSYWAQFYKPKKYVDKSLLSAIKDAVPANEKASLTESIEDFASKQDLTKQKKDDKAKNVPRVITQCAIIGYTVDEDKMISGLLVGRLDRDKLRYAGVVKRGFTPESSKELVERLKPLERPTPFFPNLSLSAVWVQPEVFCEIQQAGFDDFGYFKDPSFEGLLEDGASK
jgi:hypothetical protein